MSFIQVRWVHSCAPRGWFGSFGFIGFIWPHPDGRRVHSIHSGAPCRSTCSFTLVGFSMARPWRGRVHSASFSSFWRVGGVLRFIQFHSGTTRWSSGSFGFVGLICAPDLTERDGVGAVVDKPVALPCLEVAGGTVVEEDRERVSVNHSLLSLWW